jgi:protein-disulfide isomerase
MSLTRRDILQLSVLIAIAALIGVLLKAQKPLGEDVYVNVLARKVLEDRSSPTEEGPAANLTLVVFTDYRCPACRTAHRAMKRAVAADGRVRIVYKDWPIFGDASERAAEVALASDLQNIYSVVHDRLMTGHADSETALRAAVERSGGDWRRLQADLASNRTLISAQLARNRRQAFALRLPGTPGYLAGTLLVRGALSEGEFERLFREARKAS